MYIQRMYYIEIVVPNEGWTDSSLQLNTATHPRQEMCGSSVYRVNEEGGVWQRIVYH